MNPFFTHLVGDFILQNEWMDVNKKRSSRVCFKKAVKGQNIVSGAVIAIQSFGDFLGFNPLSIPKGNFIFFRIHMPIHPLFQFFPALKKRERFRVYLPGCLLNFTPTPWGFDLTISPTISNGFDLLGNWIFSRISCPIEKGVWVSINTPPLLMSLMNSLKV
jgi:hypothetical protein